jgi:hypothetical protein
MINLTTTFNIFFWLTLIFFNVKFFISDTYVPKYLMIDFGFLAFIFVIMWFVNSALMSSLCNGNVNNGVIAYATVPTWFIMFGLMLVALKIFPGWKTPFSNTFGYFLLVLSGYKTKLEKYIKQDVQVKYNYVYQNPLIIINEFDLSTINAAYTSETINNIFHLETEEVKTLIFKLVKFKELVSEFIWFILTGIIIISVSYNIISTNGCTKPVDIAINDHDQAISSIPDNTQDSTRVYTITE